jgi:hypothetical protein
VVTAVQALSWSIGWSGMSGMAGYGAVNMGRSSAIGNAQRLSPESLTDAFHVLLSNSGWCLARFTWGNLFSLRLRTVPHRDTLKKWSSMVIAKDQASATRMLAD